MKPGRLLERPSMFAACESLSGFRLLRARATALMLAWALFAPVVATAQLVNIETAGQGNLVIMTASAEMQVDPRTVWKVITDYDHLAQFIPDMRSSRVLQRDGDSLLVEQTGTFGFLFFKQAIEVKLSVVESPPLRIVARAVGGNFREMEGIYELESLPAGRVRLSYSGRMVPEFPIPPLIGRIVVRRVLVKQFTAMVNEIIRRDALVRAAEQPR